MRWLLGDERVIVMASKAFDISRHMRRAMEDLKEITEKFFENFLDGTAVAKPKEFSTPKQFLVLTDGPATATSFSDEGMIVALTLSIAERAKPNRTEASAVHGNIKVADAFRAEEGEGSFQSIL